MLLMGCFALADQPRTLEAPTTTPTTAPTTAPASAPATQAGVIIETYFSPKDKIGPIIVKLIDGAERSLDIAAFTFSHRDITHAIIRADQRGVKIRFVMDYT